MATAFPEQRPAALTLGPITGPDSRLDSYRGIRPAGMVPIAEDVELPGTETVTAANPDFIVAPGQISPLPSAFHPRLLIHTEMWAGSRVCCTALVRSA